MLNANQPSHPLWPLHQRLSVTVKSSGRFVWSSILDRLGGQLGLQRNLHRAGEGGDQAGQGQNLQLHGGSDTYQAFSQDTYTETSKTGHFDQGYEIYFQTPWLLSGDTTPGRLAVNWCPPATTPPPHLRLVSGQTFMVQQLAGNRCRVSAYLTHFIIQSGKLYHHINNHCQKYKSMCGVDKFSKELDINNEYIWDDRCYPVDKIQPLACHVCDCP